MLSKNAALKLLTLLSFLVITACSLAPKPLCSRIESTNAENNCPAPAPPLTNRAELPQEELAEQPENQLTKKAVLDPRQAKRREQILAKIKALKEGSDYQFDAPVQQVEITPPGSESGTYFTVQLGAFKLVEGQQKIADQIEQGPIYTYTLSNGLLAISIGKLSSFDEAQKMALMYRDSGFDGAYTIKLPGNSLNIRDE